MSVTKIKSWLPVFPGFYETAFDPSSRSDDILQEQKVPSNWDIWRGWRREEFKSDVAKTCVEAIHKWLPKASGIERIVLEEVQEQPYYNFENDAINVLYHVNLPRFGCWFRGVLRGNQGLWNTYLFNHYSSHDGFISYFPSDPEIWSEWTDGYRRFSPPRDGGCIDRKFSKHALGSCLQFWFELEEQHLQKDWSMVDRLWEAVHPHIVLEQYLNLPQSA